MKLLKTLVAAGVLATFGFAAAAEPLEFTVTFGPGGPSDTVTRIVAKAMDNKNVVVVNRPGAGGRIAMKKVMEGNAMSLATMSQIFVTNPMLAGDKLEYDPNKDLELISVVASMPNVLVCNVSKNIKTVSDLNKVSNLTFGFAGYGSSEHLATEVLLRKVKTQHRLIPYSKGGSSAIQDMVAGSIDCMFANYPTVRGWTNTDKLSTVMSSHELGLGVPTWKDTFKEDFPFQSYLGLVVSSKMDPIVKQALVKSLKDAYAKPGFADELRAAGVFPTPGVDSANIAMGLKNNVTLHKFITDNNLQLK